MHRSFCFAQMMAPSHVQTPTKVGVGEYLVLGPTFSLFLPLVRVN